MVKPPEICGLAEVSNTICAATWSVRYGSFFLPPVKRLEWFYKGIWTSLKWPVNIIKMVLHAISGWIGKQMSLGPGGFSDVGGLQVLSPIMASPLIPWFHNIYPSPLWASREELWRVCLPPAPLSSCWNRTRVMMTQTWLRTSCRSFHQLCIKLNELYRMSATLFLPFFLGGGQKIWCYRKWLRFIIHLILL